MSCKYILVNLFQSTMQFGSERSEGPIRMERENVYNILSTCFRICMFVFGGCKVSVLFSVTMSRCSFPNLAIHRDLLYIL